ncbi:hypothetical protein H0H92_003067 [Tricholoma furcatifolium]|nr:hypothetical protein H0H92_003067 [Tricholoma furcatifolium]
MSPVRLPYNMIMEDNLELRDANSKLQERLSTLQPQAYPRRESSVDTLASDGILETDAPDVDDVDMEENFSFFDSEPVLTEAPSSGLPIAGPSSIVTPARDNFQNPAGYYPTPESPQRANGARSLPLSPSLGRASFSSMTVPPSDLELDEDLATGPPILLPKYVEKASLTDNSELEQTIMNLQDELARVNATIEQERKDLDDQHSKDIAGLRRELEERIRDLEDERAVYQELLELSEAENARIENEHCQQLVGSMGVFGMDVASIVNKRQEELALAREAKKQERRELGRKMVEERRVYGHQDT